MPAAVEAWLGEAFHDLHPMLQNLHRSGGVLLGTVDIRLGKGVACLLGKRIARKLGIPPKEGVVPLAVSIFSTREALHWNRTFNEASEFSSVFTPVGRYPAGHWVESSGPFQLLFGVSIVQGGWEWQPRGGRLYGLPIPAWLLPHTSASKRADQGRYQFSVEVTVPLFGKVLAYSGKLASNLSYMDSPPNTRN